MLMHKLLEHVGVDPGRVNMSWVSASEGAKFADVVKETVEKAKAAGPMDQFRRRQTKLVDDKETTGKGQGGPYPR